MTTTSIQERKRPVSEGRNGCDTSQETAALRQRVRRTLSQETGFIANPSFQPSAAALCDREDGLVQIIERGGSRHVATDNVGGLPGHLARLCETPLLSHEQERELFRRMNLLKFKANVLRCSLDAESPDVNVLDEIDDLLLRAGRIRDHIVQANLRLVISIAKKFADSRNPFDELFSDGVAGMMRAVEKFDYGRGFRFSTYATRAVRRDLCRLLKKQQKHRQRFATNADECLDACRCAQTATEAQKRDNNQLRQALEEMVKRLDGRERFAVRARFGLDKRGTKATFVELGEALGLSKERARQIAERAIDKLRAMAAEFGIEEFALEGESTCDTYR